MATAPFPIDPVLTGITNSYRNTSLISDLVLPRVRVGKKEFKYLVYDKEAAYTVPSTLVGRKGQPGEVEFGATEEASFVYDYGLDDFIPADDVTQAGAGGGVDYQYDPRGRAVETMTDLILLDRELRTSSIVFDLSTYDAGLRRTLVGAEQWSDPTSTPVKDILEALDLPLMRPNIGVLGQEVWTQLRQHPQVIAGVSMSGGNASEGGVAMTSAVADLLGLDEILVGSGWLNAAAPGQPPSFARVWGKNAAFIHRNLNADTERGITFGFSAQFGDRISGGIAEPKRGLRGGETIRVGESLRELISAADLGFFFQNAVA